MLLPYHSQVPVKDNSMNIFQFSCSVVSDSLWPHESQHARPPCPSPVPKVYSDSCPLTPILDVIMTLLRLTLHRIHGSYCWWLFQNQKPDTQKEPYFPSPGSVASPGHSLKPRLYGRHRECQRATRQSGIRCPRGAGGGGGHGSPPKKRSNVSIVDQPWSATARAACLSKKSSPQSLFHII